MSNDSRFNFRDYIHKKLRPDISDQSNETSNVLGIPTFFNRILEEVMSIISEQGTYRRPIEIDLIQKIVGLIINNINEISLELSEFKLLLSIQIKSLIHTSILVLLIKLYYDEQKKSF